MIQRIGLTIRLNSFTMKGEKHMENKELLEQMSVMEKNANTRIQLASNKYQEAVKYEEGYKQALWDVENCLTNDY